MRSRSVKLARLIAPLGLIPLFACLNPPVESPKTTVTQETTVRVEQSVKNKVDLLFMVDNSNSMAPKQTELQNRFPQLIKQLDAFAAAGNPAWYHIGVVTSDLGAAGDLSACATAGGQGAKLQIAPSTNPANSVKPPADCTGFSLSGGENFIDYNQIAGTSNVVGITGGAMGDQVASAFTCIASVGDQGCGFEHQLESPYRALHDTIAENTGFLRSDAILAVVWVTDEDDCSASDTTDLFANSTQAMSMYGVLQSFRCTQYGIQCNGMPLTGQSISGLTGCTSYDVSNGGKLTDINTYINFFTKPAAQGGVKADPNDVILVGISAPSDPVGVTVTMPCMGQPTVGSCPTLNHSCIAASNPAFFGDPAVRLNKVITASKNSNLTSICDTDYTAAINSLGNLIISKIGVGCLNSPIANRADGTPDCVVNDVTLNPDGSSTTKEVPSCAENNNTVPCWQKTDRVSDYNMGDCFQSPVPMSCKLPSTCQPVVQAAHIGDMPEPKCSGTGMAADPTVCEIASVSINRGTDATGMPNPAPAGTTAQVSCATIASSM